MRFYRSDKARSTHFRCNEAARAFEDARVLAPSYRCWSSSVPAAFSQDRVPLDPRGPTGRHSDRLPGSQASSSPSRIDRRHPIEPRAFTSHWLSTRRNLVVRTGRSMSTCVGGARASSRLTRSSSRLVSWELVESTIECRVSSLAAQVRSNRVKKKRKRVVCLCLQVVQHSPIQHSTNSNVLLPSKHRPDR